MATNVVFAVITVIILILVSIIDLGLNLITGCGEQYTILPFAYQSSVGERSGNKLYSTHSSIGLTQHPSGLIQQRLSDITGGCDPRDIDQITALIAESATSGRKINLTETFVRIVLSNAMGLPFVPLETHDPLPAQLYPLLKSHITSEYPDAASYNAALAQQRDLMPSSKAARTKYADMAHLTLDGLALYPDGRVAAAFEYNGAVHYNVQSGDAAKYRRTGNSRALLRDAVNASNRDYTKNYILHVLQVPYIRIHYLVPTELLCDYATSRLADLRLLSRPMAYTYVPEIPEPLHQRPFDMCLVVSTRSAELYQQITSSGHLTAEIEQQYCDTNPNMIEQGILNVSSNRERMNNEQVQAWFAQSPVWQYYLANFAAQHVGKKTLKNVIAETPPRQVRSRADVRAVVAAAISSKIIN
jgi:hypothetical protein